WNLAIFEASQHKEAAWKLIQFLTREDVNGDVVELVPANMKAAKSFLAANRKGADLIIPHLENASPRPLSPRYLEVADIEVTLAQNVFSGMDPQKAAGKACTAIDALN
ncbi:MAG: sugar ABC transporter substrate-binding protein, partial [Mesorhizobium sp.]